MLDGCDSIAQISELCLMRGRCSVNNTNQRSKVPGYISTGMCLKRRKPVQDHPHATPPTILFTPANIFNFINKAKAAVSSSKSSNDAHVDNHESTERFPALGLASFASRE